MKSRLEAGVGGGWQQLGLMYEGGSVSVCLFIMFSLVVIAQFEDFTRIIWELGEIDGRCITITFALPEDLIAD